MIRKVIFVVFSLWLLQSCGTIKKPIPSSGEVVDQSVKVFKEIYENSIADFEHLQIKSKIDANIKGKSNSATLRFYFEGNERIWANASLLGITGARANIVPGKVQAYEVLDRTYVDSDFSYFNEKLKVNFITFDRLKSLLLGRLFLIDSWNAYELETTPENLYALKYKLNKDLMKKPVEGKYIHTFYLDSNYRLTQVDIQDPNADTNITVNYENWIEVNGQKFPSGVKILVKSKDNDKIELEYNNFDFTETNPPFKIPNGYSPREIN